MKKILYIQYTNPAGYPPLEHSSRILADAGWKVLFLGTGAAGDADLLRFPSHSNIVVRQIPFCPAGPLQKLHYLWFLVWTAGWTLYWRPHWIYASDLLACPVGLLVSFLPGTQLAYHEHDSPDESRTGLFLRLCFWTRKKSARTAKMCVLPNQRRADQFSKEIADGGEVFRVWNCPRREEVREARPPRSVGELLVYYHGSVGPSYFPVTILQALASLPKGVRLLVVGYETIGCVGYVQQLRNQANRLDLKGRAEFLGAMPRSDLLKQCSRHDVGIAFMPKDNSNVNEQNMVGASNKPFDYLACGLALLVSDLSDWRAMYVETGYGLACDPDSPESIAAGLRWFLDHPDEMREMGEKGRRHILEEWNYERQFRPVARLLSAG